MKHSLLREILEQEKNNLYYEKEMVYEVLEQKVKEIGLVLVRSNNKQAQVRTTWKTAVGDEMLGKTYASIYLEKEPCIDGTLYYFSYKLRNVDK